LAAEPEGSGHSQNVADSRHIGVVLEARSWSLALDKWQADAIDTANTVEVDHTVRRKRAVRCEPSLEDGPECILDQLIGIE